MRRDGLLVVGIAVISCLLSLDVAMAQRGDDDDGEGRRGRRDRGFDPTELLTRMDANKNGQLEPDEVSGRARGIVERLAERAKLDPKQPLPIEKLTAAIQERSEDDDDDEKKETSSSSTETPKTETPAASPSTTPSTTPAPETKPDPAKPLIVGFGVEQGRTLPPGFGPLPGDGEKAKSESSGSRSRSTSSSSSRGSSNNSEKREQSQKVRRYAEGLMKQYDENNNGVLEKDEWKRMRGDPEKADKNDDNIITIDELTDRLATYGSDDGDKDKDREKDRDRSERKEEKGKSRDRNSDSKASDRKSYRSLSPTERLPKGLPTWFARNDANGDGQVTMAEYSTSYNETTVAEFAKYDLDDDGIITPSECLEAEAAKTKSASTSTSSSEKSSSNERSSDSGYSRRGGR